MTDRRDQEPGSSDQQDQQEQQGQQQNPSTGQGSGSALAAMLRKRREGENHVEDDHGDRSKHTIDEASPRK
jgi:hypothetical protein